MTTARADEATRVALAWSRMPGLSPRRFWKLHEAAGGWRGLIGADPLPLVPAARSEALARAATRPFDVDVTGDLAEARRAGVAILNPFEGPYPPLLREIPDPPLVLYAAGDLGRLMLPAVGIVGARAATHYGREVCGEIAGHLSQAGVCVVSGMARGIDAAAHAAALGNAGGTIAVLGSGV